LTLHQELSHHVPKEILPVLPKKKRIGILDPAFVEERRASLELYLQQLSSLREAWSCPRFVEFLDDSHPFLGIQIQVAKLTDEVHYLRYCNSMLSSQLLEATSSLASSNIAIANLDARLKAVEISGDKIPSPNRSAPGSSSNMFSAPSSANKFSGVIGSDFSSPPISSSEKSPLLFDIPRVQQQSSVSGNRFLDGDCSRYQESSVVQTDSANKYPSWTSSGIGRFDSNQVAHSLSSTHLASRVSPPPGLTCRELYDNKSSAPLTVGDVPCNEIPGILDHFTDTILSYILPSKEQLQFRYNVEKYIAKLVRKSLGAQLYQMGIQSLRCFLPDDPISLSIYLCRGLENSWYFRLNEKLCRMSAGGNSTSPTTVNSPSRTSLGAGGGGDTEETSPSIDNISSVTDHLDIPSREESEAPSVSHHNHVISHVSFMNEHGEYRLQCLAGSTTVDIRANMKIDICFVAYLEEIDRIIGRDHLFKKSISLIRAWWTKESPSVCKTVISPEYMPDTSLLIMICALFNQFHDRIYTPIQALCIFFVEYASFDWSNYGLTAYGRIPLSSKRNSAAPHSGIIPQQMTLKYMEMLAEGADIASKEAPHVTPPPSPPMRDATRPAVPPRRGSLTMLFGAVPEEEEDTSTTLEDELPETVPPALTSEYIKIFHPLQPSLNTVPETMTHHFVGVMCDALNVGEQKIQIILELANRSISVHEGTIYKQLENAVRDLFRETVQRFGQGWRPDVVINPASCSTLSDDDSTPRNSISEISAPVGASANPQFLQDMKASEEEFT
jgi:hypothetical protein